MSYWIRSNGHVSLYNREKVDYDLSDSEDMMDLDHVRKAAVVVTSEKSDEHASFDEISYSTRQVSYSNPGVS